MQLALVCLQQRYTDLTCYANMEQYNQIEFNELFNEPIACSTSFTTTYMYIKVG